jgi:hypothetical protein
MVEETRSTEEIEQGLDGTRRRIEDRFSELSRRLQTRADAIPSWVMGASVGALVYLMRRPLLRALGSVAKMSAPVLVPLVIGKVVERRRSNRAYREREAFSGEGSYGKSTFGEEESWSEGSFLP